MQRLECEDGMPPACMQAENINSPVANHLVKICFAGRVVKMMSEQIASDKREPDLGIGRMQSSAFVPNGYLLNISKEAAAQIL